MTQYQCGVDPSEENSGVTSSDEDVPEEAKEAATQVNDADADQTSIGINHQIDEASKVAQVPLGNEPAIVVTAGTPITNARLYSLG